MSSKVVGLNRYPVKSMLGEVLDEVDMTTMGIVGDRAFAVVDVSTGKVASAKHPAKWSRLLQVEAAFVDVVREGAAVPPVTMTFPDGTVARSDDADINDVLSTYLGRDVVLADTCPEGPTFEEVWPSDVEGLAPEEFISSTSSTKTTEGDAISDLALAMAAPPGTFFDLSTLHLMTTSTLAALRAAGPEADFDVRRYRPNVLVETSDEGFVENVWVAATVAMGTSAAAHVDLPTMRCVMTTLAQRDIAADRQTLRVVSKANRLEIAGLGVWACAGVYASITEAGRVQLGDPVTISREGEGEG
jgi:uncharacterized protein YcbX